MKYEKVLGRLKSAGDNRREEIKCLDMMLRILMCMISALIHPLLPRRGRDLSVLFSPSRRKSKSVISGLEKKDQCVCCARRVKLHVKKTGGTSLKRPGVFDHLGDDDVIDEDDDVLFVDKDYDSEAEEDSETDVAKTKKPRIPLKTKGEGPIVPIPSEVCRLEGKGPRHFACESCLDKLEEMKASCPCCDDLFSRLDFTKYDGDPITGNPAANKPVPRKIYCEETLGGFRASAKLESIISDYKTKLPPHEKVLIVSFYKGTLDLLEAMFAEEKVEVARFDGDIKFEEREEELDRFKSQASCRVLLMTVQTGGTGLNLVVANHVWFTNRHCK